MLARRIQYRVDFTYWQEVEIRDFDIDVPNKRTGLLVYSVRQVTRGGRNEFEPPRVAIRNETADYIDGAVKLDNGEQIIIALDAGRVCTVAGADVSHNAIAAAVMKNSAAHIGNGRKDGNAQVKGKQTNEVQPEGEKCANWSVVR